MLTSDLTKKVLIEPIRDGADRLCIVSGYATPTMASWHIKLIQTLHHKPIDISLVVGMCGYDGLSKHVHDGFKSLVNTYRSNSEYSKISCQYVCEGPPVHSKLYVWLKGNTPYKAFTGSANYVQSAFSDSRREILMLCNPDHAYSYYYQIEGDSIYCNHNEVEENILIRYNHEILDAEVSHVERLRGSGIESVTLSFITRTGETGEKSGLNWGQRQGREPNQAYIPLPVNIARSGFFPDNGKHFSVVTDDGKQLILRLEQQNNKAITTPLNNSQIGEYFRNRIGLPNGAYVTRADLERYGRTDVTFYKLDDEHYFMDFFV